MLLLNRTLMKMAKGLWGWMGVIVGLKMVTLVGTTMFAKTISQFLGNLYAPNLTWAEAGSAILAALLAAILMFASELLTGEAEYRCTAKARTGLRRRIFAKVMELDVGNIEKSAPYPPLPRRWTAERPCRRITASTCPGWYTACWRRSTYFSK